MYPTHNLTLRRFIGVLASALCVALLSVSLIGCGGGGGDNKGRIVGTVYDGNPNTETRTSAGVKVYVANVEQGATPVVETTSDQNGRFTISVPPGQYSVYAANGYGGYGTPDSFCTVFRNPVVTSGQTTTVSLGHESCSGAFP